MSTLPFTSSQAQKLAKSRADRLSRSNLATTIASHASSRLSHGPSWAGRRGRRRPTRLDPAQCRHLVIVELRVSLDLVLLPHG